MKINNWLRDSTNLLAKTGIATARLDCLVLLEDLLHKDRSWLLAHPDEELSDNQIVILTDQITRRAQHVPLAYIRGHSEFYGREFLVNENVLEPRPESETMIDLLKKIAPDKATIVDVGTGSGALGITAGLELPGSNIILIDIDEKCLQAAKANAEKHELTAQLLQGDLLAQLDNLEGAVILANLPYVPDSHTINTAALHEPRIAIFGGEDGLDLFRRMFDQIKNLSAKPIFVLTESLPPQHAELSKIAAQAGLTLSQESDFIQVFKPQSTTKSPIVAQKISK